MSERSSRASTRASRRARVNLWDPLTIGIDIGGTKILAGVVDSSGTVVELRRRPTLGARHRRRSRTRIVELVQELQQLYDVAAVGIGAAGFVDASRSTVMFSPHLAWRDEPLRARLSSRITIPVVVDNDANTTALGESRFGAGAGHRFVLCITLGTGIGGAIVHGRPGLPRRQRHGRRVRAHAGGAGRAPLPVRQPRLLGAVRLRQRPRARGP